MTAPTAYFRITETEHTDCAECASKANEAAVMASVTGSVGATCSTSQAITEGGTGELEHYATVKRVSEPVVVLFKDDSEAIRRGAASVASQMVDILNSALESDSHAEVTCSNKIHSELVHLARTVATTPFLDEDMMLTEVARSEAAMIDHTRHYALRAAVSALVSRLSDEYGVNPSN